MKNLFVIFSALMISIASIAGPGPGPKAHRKIASTDIKCAASGEIPDAEYVVKQVETQTSCYQAADIAETCGFGSTLDNATTDAAVKICDKQTGKLKASDKSLKKLMDTRCEKVCNLQTDGTMCQSQQDFCRLDVSKFMNQVNNADN